jgi:hypothetical protein
VFEMRFSGLVRYFGRDRSPLHPANSDASPSSEASAISMPSMPMPGVNWTRHVRPRPPTTPGGPRSHLRVVK